jgi:CrcB protein
VRELLLVGCGGFVGAVLRYGVGGLVHRSAALAGFPFGTLVVNVTGCLLIGAAAATVETRQLLRPEARLFLMVGVLGGYTTFSTFGYETFVLLREGGYGQAAANAVGQVLLGLFGVWAGMVAARLLP